MRRDAALFGPKPPPTGKPGRPRQRGERLPTPAHIAAQAARGDWTPTTIDVRGRPVERLVLTRDVLWYHVNNHDLVRLVIVRDPTDVQPDDFLLTTDLAATGTAVASRYTGRWSIEVTFRDTKQNLGGQHPQCWKRQGPQRAAALSLWLHGLIWCWYLDTHPTGGTWPIRPWYRAKPHPASSTPPPPSAASSGHNELQHCHPQQPTTPKSPTPCWTPSPTPRNHTHQCESPRL